jgi:O-antigen ligase
MIINELQTQSLIKQELVPRNSTDPRAILINTFLACLSIISVIAVLSYARSFSGIWIVSICALWSLFNPYLFVVLVLPALMIFADVPAYSGSSWSILRLVFLVVAIGIALNPGRLIRHLRRIPLYLIVSMLVLLVLYILSAIYNGWPDYVSNKLTGQLLRIGLIVIVFVSVFSFDNPKLLFIGLTLQGMVMAIAGLIIWLEFGNYMVIRAIGIGYTGGNPLLYFASYGVAYASLNVTSGLACISLGFLYKHRKYQALFIFLGVLIMLASLMSSRRAAVVAMGLALLLILYFDRHKKAVLLVIAFILVTIPLAATGYFYQFFSTRESILSEFTGGGTGRLGLINYGLTEWQNSPIWGFGPGSQPEVYQEENGFSHNSIVSALLEGGIFAIIPVLALLIGISLHTFRAARKLRFYHAASIWPTIFLASLSNVLVVALISGDIVSMNNGIILLAILSAYCARILHEEFSLVKNDEPA